IALHPDEEYQVVKASDGNFYILAAALARKTMAAAGITEFEAVKTLRGRDFEFMKASHPFIDRESVVVNADYVTMDSGTGCVHTAPGFGADDYITCRRYNMDIIVPVDDKGYQTADAGKFAGMYYEESNAAILADMKESGALFASEEIVHQYPHCWRCKHPIIFRATPQWFCSVESFKDEAAAACEKVEWLPAWGGDRMVSMIKERADWCISRQRHWGLPIPVFYCEDCKKPVCDDSTISAVSELFANCGSNAWYEKSAEDILPVGYKCPHCKGTHFIKETDTLDGWFDSGSTHFSVLENKDGIKWPADMYLEGADQYRGWFQSSLLTAVGAKGQGAPFKTVLTHGWVVDGEGRAMHKSLGNSIAPEEVITKYGADIVRLWVASSDYRVDVRVSDPIFKQLTEAYRKIRNTARIIMANLGDSETDFDPNKDMVSLDKLYEIDKWALTELNNLVKVCRDAYNSFEFHVVYHEVCNFCTTTLSKLYIDITKDRVYVEKSDSEGRRAAQTTMYLILSALTRLIAPMLSFTAEEIWKAMPHVSSEKKESVFLNLMPEYTSEYEFANVEEHWNKLFALRDDIMKALEEARASKLIGKSLDAKVTIYAADDEIYNTFSYFEKELKTVFIVSAVEISKENAPESAFTDTESGIGVKVEVASGHKCDRCWAYCEDGELSEEGFICSRCKQIVDSI
ncbi:MAG: class I tRNA ligase family protein, partial [Clostridia bacterium]|nr:class I tRNA ligase family protein [Clostridia bacterium]